MVEGIVCQSGGALRVATRMGAGTTFSIYLPRGSELRPKTRYAAEPAPPRSVDFETVLVCDDDEGVRKLLLDVLEFRAYRILEGRNGRHALEVAERHRGPLHLLITDVVMPELGGVELATELRKLHPDLAVLYLSGYTEEPQQLSVPLGARTRFLAKPFLPGDLTSAVFSLLERAPSP
jgi:CheY-like chemotaxis protein